MRRTARATALGAACVALLAGCASPSPAATTTPVTATGIAASSTAGTPPTPSPTPAAPSVADLKTVYAQLYPRVGGDCESSVGAPSLLACPLTTRLAVAVAAAVNNPNGGADPICGCQAVDAAQTASYVPGTPAGGGTIHVTGFGSPQVAYVVIRSGGHFLVDDIVYCGPPAHSIFTAETGVAC